MSEEHQLQLLSPTDPLLNQPARAVRSDEITSPAVQHVIDRMIELSASAGTSKKDTRQMVGLAASQIGAPLRIITIDLTADGSLRPQQLQVVINPVIIDRAQQLVQGREGCWSCGHIHGIVERAQTVTLTGLDRDGKPLSLHLEDFVARIAQHETDHLDGIRFPDRIPEDKPEWLQWVEVSDFPLYRTRWATWPDKCPRSTWLAMKAGAITPKNDSDHVSVKKV